MLNRLTISHKAPSESQSTVVSQPAHTSNGTISPCQLLSHQLLVISLPVSALKKQTTSVGATTPTQAHTTPIHRSMLKVLPLNGQEPTTMVLAQSLLVTQPVAQLLLPQPQTLPMLELHQDIPTLHLVHQSLYSG